MHAGKWKKQLARAARLCRCCSAARSFITQGCSCDQSVNNLAVSLLGFNQNTLKACE